MDVDLLLDLPDESDGLFLPLVQMPSGGDTSSLSALQEELLAQLAQMTGKLRRNVEHFSGALVADQGVMRAAEKVSANMEVMNRERVWLRYHRGKALGTTSQTIPNVVVTISGFLVFFAMLFR